MEGKGIKLWQMLLTVPTLIQRALAECCGTAMTNILMSFDTRPTERLAIICIPFTIILLNTSAKMEMVWLIPMDLNLTANGLARTQFITTFLGILQQP